MEDAASTDSSPFVVTADGDVGIGTATPDRKLQIQNAAGDVGFGIGFTGGPVLEIWQTDDVAAPGPRTPLPTYNSAFEIYDEDDGKSRPWIADATGNVGIGTTDPAAKLHVDGDVILHGDVKGGSFVVFGFNGWYSGFNAFWNGSAWQYVTSDYAGFWRGDNGALTYSTMPSGTAAGTGTASEVLRITNDGKLGMGTDTPGSTLDVRGTLRLSGATSGYVGFAPAAAAGATTYTLPSADGTSGQQLTTNGAGVLSWAAPEWAVERRVGRTRRCGSTTAGRSAGIPG